MVGTVGETAVPTRLSEVFGKDIYNNMVETAPRGFGGVVRNGPFVERPHRKGCKCKRCKKINSKHLPGRHNQALHGWRQVPVRAHPRSFSADADVAHAIHTAVRKAQHDRGDWQHGLLFIETMNRLLQMSGKSEDALNIHTKMVSIFGVKGIIGGGGKVRKVATFAGVRHFGQPMGSIIVRDRRLPNLKILEVGKLDTDIDVVADTNTGKKYNLGYSKKRKKWIASTEDGQIMVEASREDELYLAFDKQLGGGSPATPNVPVQAPTAAKPAKPRAPRPPKPGAARKIPKRTPRKVNQLPSGTTLDDAINEDHPTNTTVDIGEAQAKLRTGGVWTITRPGEGLTRETVGHLVKHNTTWYWHEKIGDKGRRLPKGRIHDEVVRAVDDHAGTPPPEKPLSEWTPPELHASIVELTVYADDPNTSFRDAKRALGVVKKLQAELERRKTARKPMPRPKVIPRVEKPAATRSAPAAPKPAAPKAPPVAPAPAKSGVALGKAKAADISAMSDVEIAERMVAIDQEFDKTISAARSAQLDAEFDLLEAEQDGRADGSRKAPRRVHRAASSPAKTTPPAAPKAPKKTPPAKTPAKPKTVKISGAVAKRVGIVAKKPNPKARSTGTVIQSGRGKAARDEWYKNARPLKIVGKAEPGRKTPSPEIVAFNQEHKGVVGTIAPTYTDVWVTTLPIEPGSGMVVWRGLSNAVDEHGNLRPDSERAQRGYVLADQKDSRYRNFDKIAKLMSDTKKMHAFDAQVAKDAVTDDDAAIVMLIRATGIRPGSDKSQSKEGVTYGASNLQKRHVHISGDQVTLTYQAGKAKGKDITIQVKNRALAQVLKARMVGKGANDRLWQATDDDARKYMAAALPGYSPKNLRTLIATAIAVQAVKAWSTENDPPATKSAFGKATMAVAQQASDRVGNTPSMSRKSYIDPRVWDVWGVPEEWKTWDAK